MFEQNTIMTNDPSSGWDGTFGSHQASTGAYLFQAGIECSDCSTEMKMGIVTIAR